MVALLLAAVLAQAPAAAAPWPASESLRPGQLAGRIKDRRGPLVIQIGYPELYGEGHVPGSLHAGPAEEAKGLARVKKLVARLPREREIVIYCGCCHSKECANLIPAYRLMKRMGFKKLKILDLESDFHVDWRKAGFPVETESGSARAERRP